VQSFLGRPAAPFIRKDVYKRCWRGLSVGLATVYRVLTQFVDAGIVERHNFTTAARLQISKATTTPQASTWPHTRFVNAIESAAKSPPKRPSWSTRTRVMRPTREEKELAAIREFSLFANETISI
jgi:hypothetical protein